MPSTTSGSSSSTARQPSSSSIIAALQRASFGIATLPSTSKTGEPLTDADIAKLIADEAREKEKVWREHGLGAYRSTPLPVASSAGPKLNTNKRFLSSMIRSVDDHNQTLLRQQAEGARGSRDAALASSSSRRIEDDNRRRVRRSPSPTSAFRGGRGAGGMRAWSDDEGGHRSDDRQPSHSRADKGKRRADNRRSRSPASEAGPSRPTRRERSRSRSTDRRPVIPNKDDDRRRRSRRTDENASDDDDDDETRRRRRKRERERARKDADADEDERRHRRKRREEREHGQTAVDKDWHLSRSPRSSGDRRPPSMSGGGREVTGDLPTTRPRSPPPVNVEVGPPVPPPPSKMDRYFEESYDPRLDLAPLPKTGHVGEEYERMLAALEEKEKEKAEAKRRAKKEKKAAAKAAERAARKAQKNVLGFTSSSSSDSDSSTARARRKKRRSSRKSAGAVEKPSWLVEVEKREREVMDIEYAKRGEARAWDAGKVDVVEQLARDQLQPGTEGTVSRYQSELLRSSRSGGHYDY